MGKKFKVGDIVFCIGDDVLDSEGLYFNTKIWEEEGEIVLFRPYTVTSKHKDRNANKKYLHLNYSFIGYDQDGFITLKEYRKRKLQKINY